MMDNGEYASTFVMSEFWDRLQESDRDDKGASRTAKFCNRVGDHKDAEKLFPDLQNLSYPLSSQWNF